MNKKEEHFWYSDEFFYQCYDLSVSEWKFIKSKHRSLASIAKHATMHYRI